MANGKASITTTSGPHLISPDLSQSDGGFRKRFSAGKVVIESGQITIIPKPELRGFGGDSLTKPPFKVTSAEVVIIRLD